MDFDNDDRLEAVVFRKKHLRGQSHSKPSSGSSKLPLHEKMAFLEQNFLKRGRVFDMTAR